MIKERRRRSEELLPECSGRISETRTPSSRDYCNRRLFVLGKGEQVE